MISFRLTPARRDFLRLLVDGVEVARSHKRFLFYRAIGQINRKISKNNFQKFVDKGLVCITQSNQDSDVWKTTPKGLALLSDSMGARS